MTKRILFWFACGLSVLACDRRGSTPTPAASSSASAPGSAAASAAPAAAQSVPPRPQHPAERVLVTWNSALDRRDLEGLAKLYAPYVRFYGRRKSVAEVVGAKRMALGKEPDFRQRVGKVQIEKTDKGFNVHFEKQSGA